MKNCCTRTWPVIRMPFTALIERHHSHLWAVAVRTCGNPHDAADALQEALISAYQTADQFRGEGSAGSWLHRIVVNCSLDRLRRNKLHRIIPIADPETAPFADPLRPHGRCRSVPVDR